jgi:vancomycin permeability regulator SanA
MRFNIKRLKTFTFLFLVLLLTLFIPQIWLSLKYQNLIYHQIDTIPVREFAIVFGAWVNEDASLSDITRERVEAGIQLYKAGKVSKLFLSGDNRSNQQAEAMANYAIANGVNRNDVVIDKLGIDTNDTCKHFAEMSAQGILVTQRYHLPRTMLMCRASKINVDGLAVDQLGILKNRGDNLIQIHAIRTWRITREAILMWSFILGIYDRLSTEAEVLLKDK